MGYVETGCKVIDTQVFPGGFPSGAISGIFSEFDTGKSWLALQSACYLWHKEKKKTLYIDTEGFCWQEDVRDRMINYFVERWHMDSKPEIDFVFPHDVYDMYQYIGKGLRVETDEKSKVIVPYFWDITGSRNSPLYKKIHDNKYGLVIMDSFTHPVKSEIPTPPRQNFPARASIEGKILGHLSLLSKEFDVPVAITIHESKDPTSKYDTGKPASSSTLRFHVKYLMQIRFKGMSHKSEDRVVSKFRYPGLMGTTRKEDGHEVKLALNKGYIP